KSKASELQDSLDKALNADRSEKEGLEEEINRLNSELEKANSEVESTYSDVKKAKDTTQGKGNKVETAETSLNNLQDKSDILKDFTDIDIKELARIGIKNISEIDVKGNNIYVKSDKNDNIKVTGDLDILYDAVNKYRDINKEELQIFIQTYDGEVQKKVEFDF